MAGKWGEISEITVKGGDDCSLRPDCELSGTKCCDSGELSHIKIFNPCNVMTCTLTNW